MLTTDTPTPVRRPLSDTETLAALLEATGDLDTAETLRKRLPAWLLKASPTVLAALDTDLRALLSDQQNVETLMQKLQSPERFCATHLSAALTKKWSVAFDVHYDALVLPGFDCGCEGTPTGTEGVETIPSIRRNLLEAAMQNFTVDETEADGFPATSTVHIASTPKGLPDLTPEAFATLCRELDLGKRYQAHINEVFNLPPGSATRVNDLNGLKVRKLRVDAHLAFMKKHITEDAYKTLLTLDAHSGMGTEAGIQNIRHGGEPLIIQGMELFATCVWGVVIFSKRSVETYPTEWCVVYMPNEPGRPLYEYSTFVEFKRYLSLKLKVKSYKDYFAHGIDEDSKLAFFTSAAAGENLDTFKALPITVPLFQFMIQSSLGKLQLDAREVVVPTADVDEEVRKKRMENLLELGLTVANVAAFFVPVLGQLMMGVTVGMLLAEVYDGVEDWQHGDKQEALSHVLSIAQNLALMGAFAVGGKVVGSLIKKTVREHPEFFSQFESMTNPSGKARLWKSDLQPYRQPLSTLRGQAVDAQGIYQIGGQSHIRIDNGAYRIYYDAVLKKWRVRHPSRIDAFAPSLEHNGEGGWRLSSEQPSQWREGSYALKRLDTRLAALDDTRVEQIRTVTGTSISELHQLHEESRVPGARLKDAIERFRLERRISDCIAALEDGAPGSAVHAPEHLHALPSLKGWPSGRYIRLRDGQRNTTAVYPQNALVADEDVAVDVSEAELAQGMLFQKVVAGLQQSELETLIGTRTGTETQADALAKKLAASLKPDRLPLFDRLYEAHDTSRVSDVEVLRQDFAQLPVGIAQELIDQLGSVERLRLRATKRVPLGLAQKAREALAQVQLDKAISGFYLPDIASGDTNKLAVCLLEHLRGWDSKLWLEVREDSVTGPLLQSIGPKDSALKRTLVKSSAGYQAFDADAKSLAKATKGPNALYEAILRAIPPTQRTAMGLGDHFPEHAWGLRDQLLARATQERAVAARVLAGKPLAETDASVSCLQADPAQPSSPHAAALVRKTRKLYPLMTDKEINTLLDGLGTDHLSRATAVRQRQRQLETLRGLLKTWRNDDAEMRKLPGDLREYRQSRRQVADAIEDSWRRLVVMRDERGISRVGMNLDGMRVGKLPILPAEIDFSHVRRLSLKNMAQGNDLAYFIKHFKALETLELDSNQLTLLPEALTLMPRLKGLSLADNRLVLTEHTLVKLTAMRALQSLNLSKNPLGATPDVSKMFDLRFLALRDTRATELPKGLQRLPNLDRVDLRNNEIAVLPEWLFTVPRRFSETINLRTNPLNTASRVKLKAYRDSVGVGMGYLEDDIARLNEQEAKKLWLPEEVRVTYSRRGALWTALKDDPGSDGLFHLLAELGNTADSEYVREDMTQRVWSVLSACEGNASLRDQLFDLAANPINCTDSAALNFSNMEVAVEIDRVMNPSSSAQFTATPLLKLGKGLFRLDQLDQIAQTHITSHPTADPLEVSLAYRTGLAEAFELPGQPRHMRYASLSGVTDADLSAALNKVKTAELSSALLRFLVQRPFWTDYLKRNYPSRFNKATAPLQVRLQKVFDQADSLTDADYRQQLDAIRGEQATAENSLLESLTQDIMKLADLGMCVLPEQ